MTSRRSAQNSFKPRFILFLTLFFGAIFSGARATTWYVAPTASGGNDGNPGTQAQPFYDLWPAVSQAQPGDIIYMRGGTYPYTTGQWIPNSGTASAWITISNYPGEIPVIDGTSMPATDTAMGIGGQYIVIQGLTVQNSQSNGIGCWDLGHVQILNNTVTHSQGFGIYAGAVSFLNGNVDILIDGNRVFQNAQSNNPPCQNCGWPAAISTYFAVGVTISHNVSYNNFGEGIAISHSDNVCVLNNTSYDNYSVELYLDNDQFCTVGSNLAYSTFNTTYYRYGYPSIGFACANENFTPYTNPINSDVIINNVVINSRYGFKYGNFDNGGGMKNFIVANNTFYGAPDTLFEIDPDAGHSNNLIANNVFYQTSGNAMQSLGAPASAFVFSHNAWYGGSAGPCAGTGDVNLPPMLTNAGTDTATDYIPLMGSPLIDAGTTVPVVTTDYRGITRPQGPAYDIGSFEVIPFTPTPTAPTATITLTATISPPTPVPNNDVVWPNPWNGAIPLSLYHTVNSQADSVKLQLYTVGFRKICDINTGEVSVDQHIYNLSWNETGNIANGVYYLVVDEVRAGKESRKIMKLLILR